MPKPIFYWRLLLLCLLAAVVYLAGNGSFALLDRDEGWYAQISREMVRSGDWVVPRFEGQVFEGKPVMAFWCQATSMSVLGQTPFAARLPSAIATLITLGMVGVALGRAAGPKRALWTVAILASAALLAVLSKMCLTDTLLLLWITLCELGLYAMYRDRGGWPATLLFWASVGLAVLTKGPVVIGVLGGTLLMLAVFDIEAQWRSPRAWWMAVRWWLRARPWVGVPIALAVIAPWALLVQQRSPAFLNVTWWRSMFAPIATGALEGHSGWPGYYLTVIWAVWMPWSLLLVPAIYRGWRHRRITPIRFALAAVIGPWLVIELVRQKLPHYLLPTFPALAFLTADMIVRALREQFNDLTSPVAKRGVTAWALAVIVLGFAPFVAAWSSLGFTDLPWRAMATLAGIGVTVSIIVWSLLVRHRSAAALYSMAVGMGIVIVTLFAVVLPRLEYLRLAPRIAEVLRQQGTPGGDVGVIEDRKVGYDEPSLSFYQGGTIRGLGDGSCLVRERVEQWPRLIIATDVLYNRMPKDVQVNLQPVATLRGWAIGGSNRIVNVLVLRTMSNRTDTDASTDRPATSMSSGG